MSALCLARCTDLTPPSGEQWLHEVKFDGWRIQLHKHGGSAAAFTKDCHDRPGPGIGLCAVLRIGMIDKSDTAARPTFVPAIFAGFRGSISEGFFVWAAKCRLLQLQC